MNRKSVEEFDFVIIGSGFGGSVSAHRLTEKGYSVAVVEKGKRLRAPDFPKTNWNIRKFLWAPLFKCFGMQKITLFRDVFILSGVGVGGGSLVYANTLMVPKDPFFSDPVWKNLNEWKAILAPHYQAAKRMLGVTRSAIFESGDQVLLDLSKKLGCEDTFQSVDVGVYFGEKGKEAVEVDDPYFDGQGPKRAGCNLCGGCMVGCRFGAKNTLDKNYLYFAERQGAQIFAETEITKIEENPSGFFLYGRKSTSWFSRQRPLFRAKKVVFAGGVLGSVKLLLENKHLHKTLPRISDQLGKLVRTNGESLVGVTVPNTVTKQDTGYSKGIAITSAIHPDPQTKIEIVRYSKGSGFMRVLAVPLTGAASPLIRPMLTLWECLRSWKGLVKLLAVKDWANQTIILLIMQVVDNQIAFTIKRKWFRFFARGFGSRRVPGKMSPAFIEIGERAGRIAAQMLSGFPQVGFSEPLFNAPATAHILGGAVMGESESDGVVDKYCRLHNYPDLYVIDGSIIPANLGVNPSLTITALAEYAMSNIPAKN